MSKTEKTSVVIGMSKAEKEELKNIAREHKTSLSGLARMAIKRYEEDGCNEPIVYVQFVHLTQKINDLKDEIPEEDYNQIQKFIGNIMIAKGGK